MQTLADKLNGLAGQARTGASLINEALRKARGLLDECDQKHWTVTEMLSVIGNGDVRALAQMNKDLAAAYSAAVAADLAVYDALNLTRSSLSVAFTSGASLGGDQGKNDGKHLVTDPSHLTEAEIQRLLDAGKLSDDQLAQLQNGDTVNIPVAQMDYLNQLARSLDDKSPQEIQAIIDKLPPDAGVALRNSLQMISTSNITTPVKGDPGIPDQGGAKLLPAKLEQSLTRPDLVENHPDSVALRGYGNIGQYIKLNGVPDNQAIAKIAGGSDPRYRAGTDLDKQVLDVSAKYLNAQVTVEQNPDGGKARQLIGDGVGAGPHSPLTEDMFKAVGNDKAAVQSLVVGNDGKPNEQFFHDALTHQWTDQGDAMSSLFSFDHSATPDSHQTAIMNSFAQFAAGDNVPGHYAGGDDKWHLYDIPGTEHKSVGELNPKLLQTLSTSMTPYVNDLTIAKNPLDDGFHVTYKGDDNQLHSWTDPLSDGNNTFTGTKNIFSLFDTDDTAGKTFNAAALTSAVQQELTYGNDHDNQDAYAHLQSSGRLQGLVDAGLRDEISSHISNGDAIAKEVYDKKAQTYDLVKSALEASVPLGSGEDKVELKIPGGDLVGKAVDLGGDPLKEAIIGPSPTTSNNAIGLNPPNFDRQAYDVLTNTDVPDSIRQKYSSLFDSNGQLRPWQDLQSTTLNSRAATSPTDNLTALLNELGAGHGDAMRFGYDDVTRNVRADDKGSH
ncbi:hypothetical protein ACIP5Y_40660 [Nocardia sp. NPDC088792]|uniref:TPR repeat region-containing protein n=1 Tax=Nocardia sp. NPDC088792 TaxID=3364332 RepID=UPI0037F37BB8